jgi:hypothetical protein
VSDELLRRMEKAVRRFGGPAAIDNLLPELESEPPPAQRCRESDGSPENVESVEDGESG